VGLARYKVDAKRLLGRLSTLGKRVDVRAMPRTVQEAAETFEADAKANAPVVTGKLRDDIRADVVRVTRGVISSQVESGRDVDYAEDVEYGTDETRANPYMRPTVDHQGPQIAAQMRSRGVRRILREAGR
jgi:HK97 gp10 family phage protein